MSNTRKAKRKVERPPVMSLSAEQLHHEIVNDFVSGRGHTNPADLNRFIAAITRIGELRGIGAEAAYQEIRDEVVGLGVAMGYLA